MKITLLILIGFASVAFATEYDATWRTSSQSADGTFSWLREVPKSVIEKAPQWNPENGDIPLQPAEAYRKAHEAFKKLELGTASFGAIELSAAKGRPTTYQIDFLTSKGFSVSVLVFLDGTVVAPRILKNES